MDPPAPAAWNMAVDEALLDGVGRGYAMTLRIYGWARPTLSLGHAQPAAAVAAREARRRGIALVRRPTGGRAVLHFDEVTYALTAPLGSGGVEGGVPASYRLLATGLAEGLRLLGAPVRLVRTGAASPRPDRGGACFAARARYEIVAGGRKLVGSAQRRRRGRLLQHGSIPVGRPDPRLWGLLGAGADEAVAATVGLAEILGARPCRRRLAACLAAGLAGVLGAEVRTAALDLRELRRARDLCRRYGELEPGGHAASRGGRSRPPRRVPDGSPGRWQGGLRACRSGAVAGPPAR